MYFRKYILLHENVYMYNVLQKLNMDDYHEEIGNRVKKEHLEIDQIDFF